MHAGDGWFSAAESLSTLVEVLRWRAQSRPEQAAYTFLRDDNGAELAVSYAELDRQARAIAAWLQQHNAAGNRALLVYPPGLDYIAGFLGCLYAGVIAVPTYPPDLSRPERSLPRFLALLADAEATVVLTTRAVMDAAEPLLALGPQPDFLRWLVTDQLEPGTEAAWHDPAINTDYLAFLQYTSGSTSTPRGVMLSHANLLHNLIVISDAFDITPEASAVIWLPPYHDMGLIGGILQPLYRGFPCTLMSPMAFLQRPLLWLETISRCQASISGGPNFAYDLCVRKTTEEQRAALDLRSWRVAFNGAEPIRPATLDRFAAAFAPAGFRREAFYPCYGLAEATLMVSSRRAERPLRIESFDGVALADHVVRSTPDTDSKANSLVSCGPSVLQQRVLIVDPVSRRPCAEQQVGEIWVAGASVARGYWQKEEATAETFQAYLADGEEGPFLRTGDLGFLQDGELFITGRLKDLIIIDGRNHYPQDIELTVEQSHSAVRAGCTAAFALEEDGSEQLVVVSELERSFLSAQRRNGQGDSLESAPINAFDTVADAIRQAVSEQHNVRVQAVVLLKPGHIPKTSSGKIRRHTCREKYLAGKLESVAESTLETVALEAAAPDRLPDRAAVLAAPAEQGLQLLEQALIGLAAQILRRNPASIDPARALSAHGIDSLQAVELSHAIETQFGVAQSLSALLGGAGISQLAATLLPQLGQSAAPEPAAITISDTVLPLSYGQRALWFLQQLSPDQSVYTLTNMFRLRGNIDLAALGRALQVLTARHTSLRSTFAWQESEPVQQIHNSLPAELLVEDAGDWDQDWLDERLRVAVYRPFDLEHGPLLRLLLLRRADDEYIGLLSIHHLVTDFWSLALLVEELAALYRAEIGQAPAPAAPQGAGYGAYVAQEITLLESAEGERLWHYWQQKLAGDLPLLALATDRLRNRAPAYRGATLTQQINPASSRRLFELAQTQEATPFMVVLAAFYVLLYRHSGQDDLIVGVPQARREHAWARSMGYFVNSLPLRAQINPAMPFSELLAQTRQSMLEAFEHGAYPLPLLVERLQPEREPGRPPIFQVMAVWQKTLRPGGEDLTAFALNRAGGQVRLGDMLLESLELAPRVVPFDLTLLAGEADGALVLTLEYNSALFEAATVDFLLNHLVSLLEGIAVEPTGQLARLPLLSPDEYELLLHDWNRLPAAAAEPPAVTELFAAQAAQTPDAIALLAPGQAGQPPVTMRYAELEARANQLAHYLRHYGVGPEVPVAICLERSPLVVLALLGILKAGGVYLPLDPALPAERINLILDDADVRVLLTQEDVLPAVGAGNCEIVYLDRAAEQIGAESRLCPPGKPAANQAAYIFYTSGSTGTPKGVVVEHGTLAQHCRTIQQHYQLNAQDCVLQFAALTFDPSLEQILPPLLSGARVAMRPAELWTAEEFAAQAVELGLTVINIPPAYWQQLAESWVRQPGHLDGQRIRLVIVGGDRIATETIRLWSRGPLAGARLLNAYGPTEATITALTDEIVLDDTEQIGRRPVLIGRPLPGRKAYILDENGAPVGVGVAGELYLGGAGIARGYLRRPELTAERFVADPFTVEPGARLYRSGDLARYHSDGRIEFLGRVDQQVKIRGMRVEPGEIEAVLRRQEQVQDALVVPLIDAQGATQLVAYVILAVEVGGSAGRLSLDGLRARLQSQLPEYMLPAALMPVEHWPLNTSGKIDRQALPEPPQREADPEQPYVEPRNPLEELLAATWAETLNLERVGVHDNFFALGGHSLLATRLISRIQDTLHSPVTLLSLFERPTVAAMAEHILAEQLALSDDGELSQLLEEIEQMPDEIAREMLERR